jgi:DNA polymerase
MTKQEQIDQLTSQIQNCQKCPLSKTRNKPLIGDGSVDAKILIIGEAPGYYEDLSGKAFQGSSGKIFDQLLDSIDLKRDDIYITNILKCHPPKNHNPSPDEINNCIDYLYNQIKIIQPKIILTLGKFASESIFEKCHLKFTKITQMHGKIFKIKTSYGETLITPLYHPASACYQPEMLATLKQDFLKIKKIL